MSVNFVMKISKYGMNVSTNLSSKVPISSKVNLQWLNHRNTWMIILAVSILIVIISILSKQSSELTTAFTQISWQKADTLQLPIATHPEIEIQQSITAIKWDRQARWLSAIFNLSEAQASNGSLTLKLSGNFSANVYVNRQIVGSKGQPGFNHLDEVIGPIDSSFPLSQVVEPGDNLIQIVTSGHHSKYYPNRMFHDFTLTEKGASDYRSLSRYWVALSQVGLLLAISIYLCINTIGRRKHLLLSAVASVGLLIAFFAETTRAWWNYPYDFQFLRLTTVWFGLMMFAFCVLSDSIRSAPVKSKPLLLLVIVLLVGLSCFFTVGIDQKSLVGLAIMFGVTSILVTYMALQRDHYSQMLLPIVIALLIFLLFDRTALLDNGIYALGVVMLGIATLRDSIPPVHDETVPIVRQLAVKVGGKTVTVLFDKTVLISSDGNYCHICLENGESLMLRESLSNLESLFEGYLSRVHRCYIVNLYYAERIRALTGSRYELLLNNGRSIPVSRVKVSRVKAQLKQQQANT